MTESALPAARPRKILTQIAPVTWEHAADRAALQTLRSVPGFDQVVKKVVGFLGERGIRLLFQANAVRVGPTQFPRMNALYTDVLTSLDWSERPELFGPSRRRPRSRTGSATRTARAALTSQGPGGNRGRGRSFAGIASDQRGRRWPGTAAGCRR